MTAHALGVIRQGEFQMKLSALRVGREPDLLFVGTANLSRIQANYLDGPADLAVEIISPESVRRDRVTKFAEYAQAGIGEYWLIDPLMQTADFYQRNANGAYQASLPDANGLFYSAAINGLWLNSDWLWQEPLPPTLGLLKEWGVIEWAFCFRPGDLQTAL